LRHAGTRTSLQRVLRLMRQNNLLAPARIGSPRGPRSHDGTIIPETVDAMWGTDLTMTITGEGPEALFIAVDHCSAECVGIRERTYAGTILGDVLTMVQRQSWRDGNGFVEPRTPARLDS
jgi:hypothetical protein